MAVSGKKAAPARRKALQLSDERFRALIQHSADAIQLISADAKILYSSDSSRRKLEYKPDEILGDGRAPHLPLHDLRLSMVRFTALLQKPGGPDTHAYRVRNKDGCPILREATG